MKRAGAVALAAMCWAASGCAAGTALPHRPQPSAVAAGTRNIPAVPVGLSRRRVRPGVAAKERMVSRRTVPSGPRPLYLVDGRRLTHDEMMRLHLDPRDIFKVHILKGTKAMPLYGKAAAGGLVTITTRASTRS